MLRGRLSCTTEPAIPAVAGMRIGAARARRFQHTELTVVDKGGVCRGMPQRAHRGAVRCGMRWYEAV